MGLTGEKPLKVHERASDSCRDRPHSMDDTKVNAAKARGIPILSAPSPTA